MRTSTYGEEVVTIIDLNLKEDGGEYAGPEGDLPKPWIDAHHKILKPRRPDVVLRQEASDQLRLSAAARVLGMKGFLSPNGVGRHPTALLVRPQTFPIHKRMPYDPLFWRNPPALVSARFADVPEAELLLASWHCAFNSPRGREREADEITAWADRMERRGGLIGGGDANEYPLEDGESVPPIDWSTVTDHRHVTHRTNLRPDGSRDSCTYLDRTLLTSGLHDAARYAARELGQAKAIQATAGHSRPDQGGPRRIDRVYLDGRIVRAVLAVNVLDTTGISDHHGVEVVLSRRALAEALRRDHEPVPPDRAAALPSPAA
ncbi:endonuclease/exonuclease/phosphatase family protein [Streptomyces pseudovenezuelae]|uniref:Endonuclease/exonuclease/phosphatase family metal-dependent hydrolase n=1 Tax=Streptomyces pseudovenezuelae TaxID=67350 RepID=A0ABT6M2F8_9ACTN|nr:endonuclease/exonuclease/phosphatase family protein [Streptomyces pseudovenezuelae]MDH6222737.1 endonuclease/exonuclease/phosphatase family metal-dependent hydrolase [Streptomyces pseudovenezuelae]